MNDQNQIIIDDILDRIEREKENLRDQAVARYCAAMGIDYIERQEDTASGKRMVQHANGTIETANDFAELTDDEIAALEAMTSETASAEEYSTATEGAWR